MSSTEIYDVGNVQMTSDEFNGTKKSIYLILVFIVIILIAFGAWIVTQNAITEPIETNPPYLINSNDRNYGALTKIGALNYRNAEEYRILNYRECLDSKLMYHSGICTCRAGTFGPRCNLSYHDPKYYVTGMNSNNSQYNKITLNTPVNLSFNGLANDNNSCTEICERNPECKGIEYDHENKICSHITSDIIFTGSESHLELDTSVQTYLKIKNKPKFRNKVFLYSGRKPLRYYLDRSNQRYIGKRNIRSKEKRQYGIFSLNPGVVYHIDWIPFRIVNSGEMIGVWSSKPFTESQFYSRMETAEYVDRASGDYSIPLEIYKLKEVYVMYLPENSEIQGDVVEYFRQTNS